MSLSSTLTILRDHPDFGFEETGEVASKAFVQVDNPFSPQWNDDDEKKYGQLPIPHFVTQSDDLPVDKKRKSYHSTKVLGQLHDLLDEAGEEQNFSIEDEMNEHIQRKIEMAKKSKRMGEEEVETIREDMRRRLRDFNKVMGEKYSSSERNDDMGKRLSNKAIIRLYERHRQEIEAQYDEDDLPKVFAILYEQTYLESRFRQKDEPYVFAWSVGHDYLTRIIADGEARKGGMGLAPTIARGNESVIRREEGTYFKRHTETEQQDATFRTIFMGERWLS